MLMQNEASTLDGIIFPSSQEKNLVLLTLKFQAHQQPHRPMTTMNVPSTRKTHDAPLSSEERDLKDRNKKKIGRNHEEMAEVSHIELNSSRSFYSWTNIVARSTIE
jgi:hypothetical protein